MIPDACRRIASSLIATASHTAIWPGLYVTGAVACLAQVAGLDGLVSTESALSAGGFAFCTAMAVYLLDRVKLRDRWLDPADAQAHPLRFAFVSTHARLLRIMITCLLLLALWLGTRLFWGGAFTPLLAVAGVLLYAGRPRAAHARPKDVLLLKNTFVALGISGFAIIIVIAAINPGADVRALVQTAAPHALPLSIACALLFLRVLADAVLCDLDDAIADRKFGTETFPNRLGAARAWNMAFVLRMAVAAALALIPALPLWPRLAWAIVTVASSIALRVAAPPRIRDWVDGRLALEAALVGVALAWLPGR